MAKPDENIYDESANQILPQRQSFLIAILKTLREVSKLSAMGFDPDHFLNRLPSVLVKPDGYKMAWVIIAGPEKNSMSSVFEGAPGYPDVYESFIRQNQMPPCLVPIYQKTNCQVIDDFPAFNPQNPTQLLSAYASPFKLNNQKTGILVVAFDQQLASDEQNFELFEEVAHSMNFMLSNDRTLLRLKESEEKFRVLFERSSDAQMIMKGDVFIECNVAMVNILGAGLRSEIIGLTPWEVSPEYQPDGEKSRQKGLRLIQECERGHSVRFEWIHTRFDDTELPVEISLTPVNFGPESFIHIAMRDISERKKAEKELHVANQLFQLIMTHSPDMIWVRDLNLNLTYINRAVERIKGYTHEEFMRMDLRETAGAEAHGKYQFDLKNALELEHTIGNDPERIQRYEADEKCKDGSTIHVESLAAFIRDENGQPTGILGITRDISSQQRTFLELAAAKEKAEESDRLKSAFLANMSHEIRTPMNSILGFAELLGEENLETLERKQYVEIIQSGTQQLLSIISDIIDISKIQAGQVVLHPEKVNLDSLFETMQINFRMELSANNKSHIELIRGCTCHLMNEKVIIDPARLNQIMGNLISNAIKFTEQGSIRFGCTDENGLRRFFVKDTGKGISKDHQQIIFDRFRQVEESLTRTYTGTGLGLAICKGLITLMGGTIGVISEPGKGSEFWFTIPMALETSSASEVLH